MACQAADRQDQKFVPLEIIDFVQEVWVRKWAMASSVLLAMVLALLPASSATAAPGTTAAGTPWQASYQTAEASGTAEFQRTSIFGGELTVTGQLTNTGSDCYFAGLYVTRDFGGSWSPSEVQCGPGTQPVDFSTSVFGGTWTAWVYVCQGQPQGGLFPPLNNCGSGVRVP